MSAAASNVTTLLQERSQGNESVLDELTPLVYRELRRLPTVTCATSDPTTHSSPLRSFTKNMADFSP
jgi:hypothetical protein